MSAAVSGVPNEDVTSKFPRKLARDVILANDIGRDISVDPFATRDITKMFGDPRKKERGLTTLCFADKPQPRHTPSPVDMRRATGRHNHSATVSRNRETIDAIGIAPPETVGGVEVSFTKGVRWSEDRTPTHAQLRKEVLDKQYMMHLASALQLAGSSLEPSPLVVAPDVRRTPGFAGYSARDSRQNITASALGGGSSTASRFTSFPWQKKANLAKKGVDLVRAAQPTASSVPQPPPTGRQHHHQQQKSARTTTSGSHTQHTVEDEEERWNAERQSYIQRLGLGGGGGARREHRKKRQAVRGADFSSLASRKAPLFFHSPPVEVNDLMYKPKHEVTNKFRAHSADVHLGRYSSREVSHQRAPLQDHIDRIVTFESLVKFHEAQKKKMRESVFALPDRSDLPDDDEPQLSKIDDFSLHPESVRPPQRGPYAPQLAQSPSIFLYSDRPGSSLTDLIGGAARSVASTQRKRREAPILSETEGGTTSSGNAAPATSSH